MKSYNKLQVFVAACAGMGFFGVAMLSLGPILGQLNAVVAGANSLPSTMSVGLVLGTILFGPIVERFGYKWLLILASLCLLAGLQGLSNCMDIALLHVAIFMVGLGGGILNGETNALVSDISDDKDRGGRLGILGAFYCIGALGWTLLNYFSPGYRVPLGSVSVVMAAFIVWFCFTSFPKAEAKGTVSLGASLMMLRSPALWAFAIVLFFQSGFEGITGSFSISFLTLTSPLSEAQATLSLTWYTIGMLCGRLILGFIMKALHELKTFYLYLCIALLGVVTFYLSSAAISAYAALALIGLGAGATFPVIINYIAETFRAQAPMALSLAMFIGLCGQPTFNKLAGLSFDAGQYTMLPMLMIVAVLAMMAIVYAALRIANKYQTISNQ